jgi:hypothetical protein
MRGFEMQDKILAKIEKNEKLLSGFKQAMIILANRIVDELFIVTSFPFDSGIWALPSQPQFGYC